MRRSEAVAQVPQGDSRPNLSDEDLVLQVQDGDPLALHPLLERNYQRCLRTALKIVGNREEAEDHVHAALLLAMERIHQFRRSAQFSSWLIKIVINRCRMGFRQRQRWGCFDPGDEIGWAIAAGTRGRTPGPEQEFLERDLWRRVRSEMFRLPKVYREPLFLRYVDDLPLAEVAHRLGVTVTALKSRMFRAQTELRHRLAGEGAHTAIEHRSTGRLVGASRKVA